MSDIPKMKLDFQGLYKKSKQNPEMPEEELRTLFNKIDILGNLGYNAIGKGIRLEFKKPSDTVNSKDYFDQLWNRYVKPLRADFGVLINGYELEDEINELVYKLYGLDENDKKVIEKF